MKWRENKDTQAKNSQGLSGVFGWGPLEGGDGVIAPGIWKAESTKCLLGFKPRTSCVWGEPDDRYTTETRWSGVFKSAFLLIRRTWGKAQDPPTWRGPHGAGPEGYTLHESCLQSCKETCPSGVGGGGGKQALSIQTAGSSVACVVLTGKFEKSQLKNVWSCLRGSTIFLYSDELVKWIILQIVKGRKSVNYCIVTVNWSYFVSENMHSFTLSELVS